MATRKNENQSYMSKHPEDNVVLDAILGGAAAAGRLADDHTIPSNMPVNNVYNAADLHDLYRHENIFITVYNRINKIIHGGE